MKPLWGKEYKINRRDSVVQITEINCGDATKRVTDCCWIIALQYLIVDVLCVLINQSICYANNLWVLTVSCPILYA